MNNSPAAEKTEEACAKESGGTKTMRVRFTSNEEMIILKEVVAAKSYAGKHDSVVRQFEVATEAINNIPLFRTEIKTRAVQEKFNKIFKLYKHKDKERRKAFGIGGDPSAMDDMLSPIVEAAEFEEESERKEAEAKTEAEKLKIDVARCVIETATAGGYLFDNDILERTNNKNCSTKGSETLPTQRWIASHI